MFDDPAGKKGRIIPLVIEKFDPQTQEPLQIPFALRLLRYIDFSRGNDYETQYELLLARLRGQRPARGHPIVDQVSALGLSAGSEIPGIVDEVLLSNLFPATLPNRIFSDFTTATCYADVRKCLSRDVRVPFVIYKGRLYSFVPHDSPDNPFRPVLAGSGRKTETTTDLAGDPERVRHLIWLCNDALRDRCFSLRLRNSPSERSLYYPVVAKGEKRSFSWGKGAPLTIAKVNNGERPLGVHHAALMRFIELAGRIYLLIEPRYFFTTDGLTPVAGDKAGRYSVKWGNKEGNATVLRRLLMWPRIIAAGHPQLELRSGGPEPIRIAQSPQHGRTNRGILGDTRNLQALFSNENAGEVLAETTLDEIAAAKATGELEVERDEYGGDEYVDDDSLAAQPSYSEAGNAELELPL